MPTLSALTRIVEAGVEAGQPEWAVRKANELIRDAAANLRKARAAGVRFAGGSDAGTPFNGHDRYWHEVELMHTELGMTPLDALRTATAAAADLLGVDRGRIRSGAPADVLLLARDVTENLTALREPAVVVKDGAIVRERA